VAYEVIRQPDHGRQVLIFESKEQVCRFTVDRFWEISERTINEWGRFSVALSGGKTPQDIYVEIGRVGQGMDWRAIHVFLVDERFVPPDDDRSNFRMIKKTLLDAIPIPVANLHAVATEETDPRTSAKGYEAELMKFFGTGPGSVPAFDMILLGMGEDGHTASLFPGVPDLQNDKRLVRAVEPAGARVARVTLTLPVINGARNVFFLVTGETKARTVRRVVEEQDPTLPASLVRPLEGALLFLCDREAGSLLDIDKGEAKSVSAGVV
jgi:6-phosphogluconolactonase